MSVKIFKNPGHTTPDYTFPSADEPRTGWGGGMESMAERMSFRSTVTPRRWSPGGMLTGDNLMGPREIIIGGIMKGPSRAEVQLEINRLKNACYRPNHNWEWGWLQTTQYSTAPMNQVYKITGVSQIVVDWITDISVEVMVRFQLADPYRYDRSITTVGPISFTSTPYTWEFDVPGGAMYQLPEVLVQVRAGTLHRLVYRSNTVRRPNWSRMGLALDGMNILAGAYPQDCLLINSSRGMVELCDSDKNHRVDFTQKITAGDFPVLSPGTNRLEFRATEGTRLSVEMTYRARYL